MAATLMTACGVPQGLYQASLRDVERLKAERAATSIRCSESSDRARTDLSRCNISRSKAEAHTKVLESDLVRLKTAAGELEGDLETMGERVRRLQEEQAKLPGTPAKAKRRTKRVNLRPPEAKEAR